MSAFAPLPPRLPKTVDSKMSDPAFWEATILEDITIKVPLDPRVVTWASLVDGKELKRLGIKFVGSTTMYALMQSTGMVKDHSINCFLSN